MVQMAQRIEENQDTNRQLYYTQLLCQKKKLQHVVVQLQEVGGSILTMDAFLRKY